MKIGVFICECGNNISATVDVEQVARHALELPRVVCAHTFSHMCAESGQQMIRQAIREKGLTRVVIGACSPRVHEATFQRVISQAGLNPYLLEIANLREQCSWIHEDREAATLKAMELVGMAVYKVQRHQPLTPSRVDITPRTLIIGGGIAGMQTALDIANSGHDVVLVERRSSIGGNMARLDKTFPTLDCSGCILSPKMVEVATHPRITLLTFAEVEQVSGFVGNFKATIRQKARLVDASKCTGCGVCTQKCPLRSPSKFNEGMSKKSAIYIPFPQAIPHIAVIDRDYCAYVLKGKCGLCKSVCPAGAIDYDQKDTVMEQTFGAIVVATGYELVNWKAYGEYGYGRYPDVISNMQYERILSASGPTGGHIKRPSDGKPPEVVAIVACVGSRDEAAGRPYCSNVCCMCNAKYGMLTREHLPNSKTYIFYMDIRATGKLYEEFIRRSQEKYGVQYIRGRVSKIFQRNGRMVLKGTDTLLGEAVELEADLVILSAGIAASSGTIELAKKLNISHDQYGFLTESHPKLRPVESSMPGIFIAGAAQAPKDIPTTIAQASSAACKVMSLFTQKQLETSPQIAEVNPRRCIGCFRCKEVCPASAIEEQVQRDGTKKAMVNPAICQGCGLCNATCLPGAISLKGFTDDQIIAELESLCNANS